MALVTAHGASLDLGNGTTRYFVSLEALNVAKSLLEAGAAGNKRKVVYGELSFSGAAKVEIKNPTTPETPLWHTQLFGAAIFTVGPQHRIISGVAELLRIEAGADIDVDGFLDVVEGTSP